MTKLCDRFAFYQYFHQNSATCYTWIISYIVQSFSWRKYADFDMWTTSVSQVELSKPLKVLFSWASRLRACRMNGCGEWMGMKFHPFIPIHSPHPFIRHALKTNCMTPYRWFWRENRCVKFTQICVTEGQKSVIIIGRVRRFSLAGGLNPD